MNLNVNQIKDKLFMLIFLFCLNKFELTHKAPKSKLVMDSGLLSITIYW